MRLNCATEWNSFVVGSCTQKRTLMTQFEPSYNQNAHKENAFVFYKRYPSALNGIVSIIGFVEKQKNQRGIFLLYKTSTELHVNLLCMFWFEYELPYLILNRYRLSKKIRLRIVCVCVCVWLCS